MIRQTRRHRGCLGLPPLDRPVSICCNRLGEGQAVARVWQDKVMGHLEQDEWLSQPTLKGACNRGPTVAGSDAEWLGPWLRHGRLHQPAQNGARINLEYAGRAPNAQPVGQTGDDVHDEVG